MEQLPALSTVLCLVLLIPTWGAAAAKIPAGCRIIGIRNAGSSTQTPDGLRVSQEPRSLNVTVGKNVTLTCTFQYKNESTAKVVWFRGSGEDGVVDSTHPFYRERLHVSSLDDFRQGKATLTLSQLEERDTGLYQCCIEIYNKETGMGGGTELRVMQGKLSATGDILAPGNNRKDSQRESSAELTIYRALIALEAASIIVLAGALVLRRHKGAAIETPPQASVKRDRRPGNDASEGLHYAEIRVKSPVHTEYASVRTQQL